MSTGVGILLGIAVLVGCVVRAVRGLPVPAFAAVVGPMVLLIAVRRSFATFTPGMPPDDMAAAIAAAVPVAWLFVGLGVFVWVAGIATRWIALGAPALSQVGALMVSAGLLWVPWAQGQADLWTTWQASPAEIEATRAASAAAMAEGLTHARWVMALAFAPVAVWGFVRERWPGLGEGVAAGVLIVLALTTGQPAREAVVLAHAPWLASCSEAEAAGVGLPGGGILALGRPLVRREARGWERFVDGEWSPVASLEGEVLLVVPPATTVREVQLLANGLPGDATALLAGRTAAGTDPRNFDRHPVVVASRCRAWRVPADARSGSIGDAIGRKDGGAL